MVFNKRIVLLFFILSFSIVTTGVLSRYITLHLLTNAKDTIPTAKIKPTNIYHPLSIEIMRKKSYPGSILTIEQTLEPGSNYTRSIASYSSDGLKIYGLLTIPTAKQPEEGFPAIIFNHGYIAPETYVTTERYVAYLDAFARDGYVVFKPDYRGHGSSEGKPEGAYYSPAYATDVLNALESVKKLPEVDKNRIGMWGHSMGGNIILRDIVINTHDIKAAVIWGGVVASYYDLMNNWHRKTAFQPSTQEQAARTSTRRTFTSAYGTPETNQPFWNAIDPWHYLSEIKTPIQLHAGENDEEVPAEFSAKLYEQLTLLHQPVEFYIYPNGDHNISSPNFETAIDRSVKFFDKYLK